MPVSVPDETNRTVYGLHPEDWDEGWDNVTCGGESDRLARAMHYDWVLSLRQQCIRQNVFFEFRQYGTHFIKDGKEYTLQKKDLCSRARKAAIKSNFEELYRLMNGKYLKEIDEFIYVVCTLCRDHEKAGFIEGVKKEFSYLRRQRKLEIEHNDTAVCVDCGVVFISDRGRKQIRDKCFVW